MQSGSVSSTSSSAGYTYVDSFKARTDGTVELDSSADANSRSVAQYLNVVNSVGTYPKTFTVLARVLPVAGVVYDATTKNRLLDIDVAMADAGVVGSRMQVTIVADDQVVGVRVNNTNVTADTDSPAALDLTVPHTYQISTRLTSPNAGTIKVYVDGAATPLIDVTTTDLFRVSTAGDNYIRIGDQRDSVYRSYVDWVIWSAEKAFDATELKGRLPTGIGSTAAY